MIRAATEDDIGRVLEIEREAISPPWTHGSLLNEIYNGDSFFALAGSEPITGFLILRRIADEGELFQVAVDKTARRRGVASALMEAAFFWARETGLHSIFLEVRKSNEAAIGLYKKFGFLPVGERKNYYADPVEDAVVMRKDSQ